MLHPSIFDGDHRFCADIHFPSVARADGGRALHFTAVLFTKREDLRYIERMGLVEYWLKLSVLSDTDFPGDLS